MKGWIFIGAWCLCACVAFADTPEEYLDQGNDAIKAQAYDQAIFDYTQALDRDPNLTKAYNNRGVAYAFEGSFKRAIADFTLATVDDPYNEEAFNNRGHAYGDLGHWIQAVADYSKAIEINPFYIKAYSNRKIAYFQLKAYDKAWADVFKIEELGGKVDHDFYEQLKKASAGI